MLARFCYNRAMIEIFDTHTHLNVDNFAGKEQEEIDFAAELGVVKMNIVGFDKPTINKSLALSERYDQLYSTIGWHPTEAGSYSQEIEDMIVSQLDNPKVVALGEIGLDYYWMEDPKETQIDVFKRQIALSKEHNLPFVVHTRDALEDTYAVIKEVGVGPRGGIMHSYSGSLEMAQKFVDLGMMISFSGVVTFKKALDVQEAAQKLPLDKILVETDAPYLAVEGKDDTANLRRFYEVDTYETRGSAINEDDLERINKLNDLRGVIVFTDPDYNGERIRKIIMEAVPTAKHAFLNRGEATPKSKTKGRSLGVEHASFEDLQKALSGVLGSYDDDNQFDISKSNLMKLGLLMGADSRKRREYLGEALRIGYCNGKQLLKRLELFGITLEELEEAMSNY